MLRPSFIQQSPGAVARDFAWSYCAPCQTWQRATPEGRSQTSRGAVPSQFVLIGLLSSVKFHGVAWLIDHAGLLVAWLFNVALTLGLVFLATWAVVHVAPAAAGAPRPPSACAPRVRASRPAAPRCRRRGCPAPPCGNCAA